MAYSCQVVGTRVSSFQSCCTIEAASLRKPGEAVGSHNNGSATAAGAMRIAGKCRARKLPTNAPWPGWLRCNAKWFSGEAKKNQAAFGKAGKRAGPPPKPSEKPKGSFQNPKPQVPGKLACEQRARNRRVNGGRCGNAPRAK